tara:strand:+ start:141 stop:863 length:723 start_codon:yes stop_codon:yes gene_type:complete
MNYLEHIFQMLSYQLLPLLFAMVLHEFAHGWVANYFGDPTARLAGRLTLNPKPHIDPIGTVLFPMMCLILQSPIFFGYAKPVPVNFLNLHYPKRDMVLVAAAGPGMNFLLAIISGILLRIVLTIEPSVANAMSPFQSSGTAHNTTTLLLIPLGFMLLFSIKINVLLMLFNLLPIPPLDGGRITVGLLPYNQARMLSGIEPYGMMIVIMLVAFDSQLQIMSTFFWPLVNLATLTILSGTLG